MQGVRKLKHDSKKSDKSATMRTAREVEQRSYTADASFVCSFLFLNLLLHVEGAAWNIEYRHAPKEVTEQGRVQGGRGHDELQVAAPGNHFPQNPEEHVGVQRPLVGFVHDDGAVRVQVLIQCRNGSDGEQEWCHMKYCYIMR